MKEIILLNLFLYKRNETYLLLKQCVANPIICTSTDKSCNPSNLTPLKPIERKTFFVCASQSRCHNRNFSSLSGTVRKKTPLIYYIGP